MRIRAGGEGTLNGETSDAAPAADGFNRDPDEVEATGFEPADLPLDRR